MNSHQIFPFCSPFVNFLWWIQEEIWKKEGIWKNETFFIQKRDRMKTMECKFLLYSMLLKMPYSFNHVQKWSSNINGDLWFEENVHRNFGLRVCEYVYMSLCSAHWCVFSRDDQSFRCSYAPQKVEVVIVFSLVVPIVCLCTNRVAMENLHMQNISSTYSMLRAWVYSEMDSFIEYKDRKLAIGTKTVKISLLSCFVAISSVYVQLYTHYAEKAEVIHTHTCIHIRTFDS